MSDVDERSSEHDDEDSRDEETQDIVAVDFLGSSSSDVDERRSEDDDEDSWGEETRDIVAVDPVGSSPCEDEGPNPGDRLHLWIYQIKNVSFLIKAFRRAYAEEIPGILRRVWLSPCDVRHSHTRSARNARERLHNCAREIRKLWNKTRRVCVRKRICTYGNVRWNVRRRMRTAAVYDLIQCQLCVAGAHRPQDCLNLE